LTPASGVGLPKNQKLDEIDGEGRGKGEAILESRLKVEDWQMATAVEIFNRRR
jgi:hypothetical protein